MITHLSIENFAVIKALSLDLKKGLNIITGETGAGKSVIIEAVSMALGARADTDYIRTGEEKASITMVIDGDEAVLSPKLSELGVSSDVPVVLKRELSVSGKSLCRINGDIVPLSKLSGFCAGIADIHGQYDHQSLLDPEKHVEILDTYGGPELKEVKDKVFEYYTEYSSASSRLMGLRRSIAEARRQRELYRLEISDIDAAALSPGEDEELEQSISVMQHAEQIFEALSAACEKLSGSCGAVDSLSSAMSSLDQASKYSNDILKLSQQVGDIYYQADDIAGELRRLRDRASYSPRELEEAIERQELINGLKKKYGSNIEEILEYRENAQKALDTLENADDEIKALENTISFARASYDEWAEKLTGKRREAASLIEEKINVELSELNFHSAVFAVSFTKCSPSPAGNETAEFMISANRGESLKPLSKVASGGELSRVMLALKRIIGDLDNIPTMIFDEIDTGISGATAGVVGRKLRSISKNHQIVCITHLPQIASMGDHHYLIRKDSDEISTKTTVVPLSDRERVEELARLLSGTEISDAARAQARELLIKGLSDD